MDEMTDNMTRERAVSEQVRLEQLDVADAGELLTLQRAAYAEQAQRDGDPFLPALTQTLDELVDEIQTGGGFVLRLRGRLVGAVRTRVVGGELHIGRLTVAPDMQGRGFGGALLHAAESEAVANDVANNRAGEAVVLWTGRLCEASMRLYTRRGYIETHREKLGAGVELVHLRKELLVA
jgi:GNAT superfamily N-acetyltransferase